ncbi:MAG: DUF429 domain-containing protein [Chloroflexota bacterium]|nr:DUF429 domain-containing protein [Chloroflexota bacterium]
MKCIAVDWSGAESDALQLQGIALAIAEGGSLTRVTNGLVREEVIGLLMQEIKSGGELAIGMDFAFSFPAWYLQRRKRQRASAFWELAAKEGETWLDGNTWPFWGRKGRYQKRPVSLNAYSEFRKTDDDLRDSGFRPQSVFKVYGAGTVGTGSIRGLPFLANLRNAGAAIWPFDAASNGQPIVIEIYPRYFYTTEGINEVINNGKITGRDSRQAYLASEKYRHIEQHWRDFMIGNEHAFDAGISALKMSAHAADLRSLQQDTDAPYSLEGRIWTPPTGSESCPGG